MIPASEHSKDGVVDDVYRVKMGHMLLCGY